jgi:hypothetical protein
VVGHFSGIDYEATDTAIIWPMKWHQLLIGIKRSLTNGLRFHRCKNDSLWSGWGNGVLWNVHKIAKDRLHGVKLSGMLK